MSATSRALTEMLQRLTIPARKLFCVIVREAFHGPMHPKQKGTAVPAEVLEACGLDVGEFYVLLAELAENGLIRLSGAYPFEELSLTEAAAPAEGIAEQCRQARIPLEHVLATPGADRPPGG